MSIQNSFKVKIFNLLGILILTCFFTVSCNKESEVSNTTENVELQNSSYENPYEFVGILHNQVVEHIFREGYKDKNDLISKVETFGKQNFNEKYGFQGSVENNYNNGVAVEVIVQGLTWMIARLKK